MHWYRASCTAGGAKTVLYAEPICGPLHERTDEDRYTLFSHTKAAMIVGASPACRLVI